MTPRLAPSKLYAEYIFDGNEAALQFWGPIPKNIKEAINLSTPLIDAYQKIQPVFTQERFHGLIKSLEAIHKKFDMFSPQVKENLANLQKQGAVIEAGHQPALFGGPGFVINKIAAIAKIALIQQTTPLMFVGDHDHEQKELTVIHLPSPGPRGLTFSLPVSREFRMSPMHVLPLPPKKWLKNVIEKITATYHELVIGSAKQNREDYEQRLNILRKLLETTYNQANSIAEWTIRLWYQIINITQDSGVLFQNFSYPAIRELMVPAFEYLLRDTNRRNFIKALNTSAEKLEQLGYEPGIGRRADDYVPFHLECPTADCNRTRLDPTITSKPSEPHITISAQCSKCKITHTIEVKATAPDLADWKTYLSPRVDTRAFLVQSYTPVILHVGGAGETSYHAQVIPALQATNSVAPIFYRYTRIYYENPWSNSLAQKLAREKLMPLNHEELQCFEAAINTGYDEENTGVVQSLFAASQEHITDTIERLIEAESQLEKERNKTINHQREITNLTLKKENQAKIGRLTRRRQILQTYLSQMFGRYSTERLGQEVSYLWLDAAISIRPSHHFSRLLAHYQKYTPSSATFYLVNQRMQH
jgi:uncharacterized protein YllA (UPF0747 family)